MSRKKKSRVPMLAFVLVVVGLVAFSLFDFKKMQKEQNLGEGEQKLLTLTEGEVIEIDFKSKKQTIVLKNDKKEGNSWKLSQPLEDEADDLAVVGVINALREAKISKTSDDVKKDSKPIDWAQYGLDPGVQIEVHTDLGTKDIFKISDTNAYDGSFYVQKNNELFLGDKGLARLADMQIPPLRSHNIWRTPGEVIRIEAEYTYDGEPRHVTLNKDDKGWTAKPPFDLPISQDKIRDWLQELRDVRFNDFAAPQLDAKGLGEFNLAKPAMKVTFTMRMDGKETPITWLFGQEKNNMVFVHTSAKPDVYKGTKFTFREVRLPLESFVDAPQALKFALEDANEMDLAMEGHALHFTKGDKDWSMQGADPKAFQPAALVDFFQKLKALDPIGGEIPKDLKMDPAKDHLILKGQKGAVLEISWTPMKDQLRWLKISKFKERFKVSAERFNALMKTEFLSKSTKAPTPQETHP